MNDNSSGYVLPRRILPHFYALSSVRWTPYCIIYHGSVNRQVCYVFMLLTGEHQLRVKKGKGDQVLDMSCNCRRVLDACYFAFLSPSHPASQRENAMTTAVVVVEVAEAVAYRGSLTEKTA